MAPVQMQRAVQTMCSGTGQLCHANAALISRPVRQRVQRRALMPLAAQHHRHSAPDDAAAQHKSSSTLTARWGDLLGFKRGLTSALCVGAGTGVLAGGGPGSNGPVDNNGGWGGGDGPFSGSNGGSGAQHNVLGDTAHNEAADAAAAGEVVIVLDVGGMKCGGCVSHVKRLLEEQPSVAGASVNLATETALVRVRLADAGADSNSEAAVNVAKQLAQALTAGGFNSSARDHEGGWSVGAMLDKKRDQKLKRLKSVTINLVTAWGLSVLCALGHTAHVWAGAPQWMHALHNPLLSATLSAAALLGPGREILSNGFDALMRRRPDMNTLVGLGATASFGVSCVAAALPALGWKTFFEEPAMLLGFVLVGRALEERAKLQASSDMAALQQLLPTKARLLLANSGWAEVPAEAVVPGDVLVVLPGDRVPVDGVVQDGRSSVDESALTGEPLPLLKEAGSKVTAGTLNCDGSLTVRAEQSGQETVIADIVRMVESAQARTAPIQRLADTVAGRFSYGVMGLSAATFVFWSTVGTKLFPQVLSSAASHAAASPIAPLLLGLQLACNVLVVACPCALGLATPTAVLVGTAAGARRGLLIRGGDILEATSQVDTVVFDKTGTLTAGRPQVSGITMLSASVSQQELLQLAAAVERNASHPVAHAVVVAAATSAQGPTQQHHEQPEPSGRQQGSQRQQQGGSSASSTETCSELVLQPGSFTQEPGSGAAGIVSGRSIRVGTLEWVMREGAELEERAAMATHASTSGSNGSAPATGHTHVFVGVDGRVVGLLDVADRIRTDARATVQALQQRGLRTLILSGDRQEAAAVVGNAVGIAPEDVHAGVKPAGKAAFIESLQRAGRRVAMVGDGVNDAAALATAHVGVAMGGGVDAASDVAGIVLKGDQVAQVADAIDLSRRTLAKIQQNLVWAFGYNAVGIPLAAGVLLPSYGIALTPSISGALMGLSSLAVMGNSLLLRLEANRSSVSGGGAAPLQQQRQQQQQPPAQQQQREQEEQAHAVGQQHLQVMAPTAGWPAKQ